MIQSQRGSIWRKWDLQIHTPFSHLNNQFGDDFRAYFKSILERAEAEKVFAIGITDYFTIEGYKSAVALMTDDSFLAELGESTRAWAKRLLLLPNIELRTNFLIKGKDGKDSRVNMHVILSDEVTSSDIEEHFLRETKFWNEAQPQQSAERHSLTTANLEELGKSLRSQHLPFQSSSDIFVGMMNAVVDANEVAETLAKRKSKFDLKYLIAFPCDEDLPKAGWDGQAHHSRKLCIQMADLLFSSNEGTRKFGLGEFHDSPGHFISEFKSLKPCLHTSDAHSIAEAFVQPQNRHTWIKADVTFEGLRQVLHEPEHRVFIGERPDHLKQVTERSTKYINTLSFSTVGDLPESETWFAPATLQLNSGLVAIIGKKGSGKSALSDVIGLLGNSSQVEDFSFLNPKRFWLENRKRGKSFQGTLLWHDKKEQRLKLSDSNNPNSPEAVKYIPQSYLERICNEIERGTDTAFQKELRQVIFSHIKEDERIGASTLEELLAKKTEASVDRLTIHRQRTHELTRQILELEASHSAEALARLKADLEIRNREIAAHEEGKPAAVPEKAPDTNSQLGSEVRTKLVTEQANLKLLEEQLTAATTRKSILSKNIAAAVSLLDTIANAKLNLQPALDKVKEKATVIGLNANDLVTFTIQTEPVDVYKKAAEDELNSVESSLDAEVEGSLAHRAAKSKGELESTQKQLDEPERLRQVALQTVAAWEKKKAELIGSVEQAGSQKHIEAAIEKYSKVPTEIVELRSERLEAALKTFDSIKELEAEFDKVFESVRAHYSQRSILPSDVNLGFAVTLALPRFPAELLGFLDQTKKGSFRGSDDGLKFAKELVEEADLETREGAKKFLGAVLKALEHDLRSGSASAVGIGDQVRRDVTVQSVIDFVFDLNYLRPKFELQWDGKPPELLSPGERGSLLLIFYLLIDLRQSPLVIDQPEENLDNETIFRVLVPCIKYAKQRRQLIVVTHNPNLAVVSDADQIIYASIDKNKGNELTYECGAIENAAIKSRILDVLEGTEPAFKKREARYDTIR